MGIIAKFSEGGNGLGGMSKTQNKVRIGQKNVQMLIKSEIQGFRGGIRTGKEKKFSEGGIGQGAKNFLQRGEQDGEEKFSSEGEQGREPEIFCRGGIRTGKKIFSSDGGGEGGNVIKMRKFPDQGCSKLLWGRGVMTEGELPPPSPPPCAHVWLYNLQLTQMMKDPLLDLKLNRDSFFFDKLKLLNNYL